MTHSLTHYGTGVVLLARRASEGVLLLDSTNGTGVVLLARRANEGVLPRLRVGLTAHCLPSAVCPRDALRSGGALRRGYTATTPKNGGQQRQPR